MLDPAAANYWLPVDQYIGTEHAIMHLMYFRFFHKLMRDAGLVDLDERQAPAVSGHGAGRRLHYTGNSGERLGIPVDATVERDDKGRIIKATDPQGRELVYAGMSKMSKSKNNGIDPGDGGKYGADTVRLFKHVRFTGRNDAGVAVIRRGRG